MDVSSSGTIGHVAWGLRRRHRFRGGVHSGGDSQESVAWSEKLPSTSVRYSADPQVGPALCEPPFCLPLVPHRRTGRRCEGHWLWVVWGVCGVHCDPFFPTVLRCLAGGPPDEHWVFYYDVGETVIEKYMLSLHWSLTQFTPAGTDKVVFVLFDFRVGVELS